MQYRISTSTALVSLLLVVSARASPGLFGPLDLVDTLVNGAHPTSSVSVMPATTITLEAITTSAPNPVATHGLQTDEDESDRQSLRDKLHIPTAIPTLHDKGDNSNGAASSRVAQMGFVLGAAALALAAL